MVVNTSDWSPEQQQELNDRVTNAIAEAMLKDKLPAQTVRKLIPFAELAWRGQDPSGALLFLDIGSPSPRVEFMPEAEGVKVELLKRSSNRYVLPLRRVFEIAMRRGDSENRSRLI